jgi:uncharacterized membrane protein
MGKARLEAFSDGVLAIIITIMVLELPTPHGTDLAALKPVLPILGAYLLAFINVGIYWSNQHHMLQAATKVDGSALWANNAMLFVLSLVPFLIRWMGEEGIHPLPVALYGVVLVLAAAGYLFLERSLIALQGEGSKLKEAVGSKKKEWVSVTGYLLGAALAFVSPVISVVLYVAVTSLWFIPDSRIEKQAKSRGE